MQPAEINYTLDARAAAPSRVAATDRQQPRGARRLPAADEPPDAELSRTSKLLGSVSDTYADVFPDIAATLRNSVKTGTTLLEKERTLNAFLND